MPARPVWNGHLKLSLVTCAVSLFPATTRSEKVGFHMLNQNTGHRLKQQYVDEESRELVEREQRIRGYDTGEGVYVEISEEDPDCICKPRQTGLLRFARNDGRRQYFRR